jgi:chemotaxis protein CheX
MIIDVCLNDAVLEAIREVIETMTFAAVEESSASHSLGSDSIMGTITFRNTIKGCLAFNCNLPCAKAVAANMLGLDNQDDLPDEDVADAIGEITNMVMGSLKTRLSDSYEDIQVSIPSVVRGRELVTSLADGASRASVWVCIDDKYYANFSLLLRNDNGNGNT